MSIPSMSILPVRFSSMIDRQAIESVFRLSLIVAFVFTMLGCAKSAHQTGQDVLDKLIPPDVMAEVDQSVSFRDLHSSPENYIGRTVLFGGTAIKSHRVKDHTEIEIMQLPIVARKMPSDQRSQSEGRFIASQSGQFLDPAVIEQGSPLTVVGQVKGSVTKPLDESEYQYPVLEIKHLVNWKELRTRDSAGGYGGYGYMGYGYPGYWPYSYGPYGYGPWGYGGYYGSPFWGPYGYGRGFYPYYGGGVSPAPSPSPPPSSVPPRFQKGR
jgi:outer membrane lipoprotein